MFRRQTSGSVLCPSCGQLVGVRDEKCLNCGRANPGLWGFSGLLKLLGRDLGFVRIVLWSCGLLYVCTLVVDPGSIRTSGLAFLSPGIESLFLFGASGAVPVFRFGRWWTVLSAAWLHGGLLHIAFNMMWVRDLGAGHGPPLRRRAHRHHLHRRRRGRLRGEQPGRRLPRLPARFPARRRLHRRGFGAGLRSAGRPASTTGGAAAAR